MQYLDYQEVDLHIGRRERLRLRIRLNGIETLKNHEIIEYLLYYTVPRQDMNQQAHALIDRFGSVREVLQAETKQLMDCGIGKSSAEWLCTIGEAMLGIGEMRRKHNIYVTNLMAALVYGYRLYDITPKPASIQLCTDKYGRVIFQREITPSRSWGEPIVLRDAINDVISTNAKGAIILQFTGREPAEPDEYDTECAKNYALSLEAAGCSLNDVVLIGDGGSTSMRQHGMISEPKQAERSRAPLRRQYLNEAPDVGSFGFADYLKMTDEERERLQIMMQHPAS